MADNSENPTVKMPPLENWAAQTFAYGFLLDRSASFDYSGNTVPGKSGRSGFDKPQPDDLHLLNLNPQDIQYSEPIATAVEPSQGGGKFVESKGGVMKTLSITGTTGFMPPVAPYAQHMKGPAIPLADIKGDALGTALRVQENQTGFFEFYRLRRLFRQFMLERRQGKIIHMHWLDFKGDEFWVIEPQRFNMRRTRFSYEYEIQCDCIEPSQLHLKASNQGQDARIRGVAPIDRGQALLRNPLHGALDSTQLKGLSRLLQMTRSAKDFVNNFATGVLALKMQSVLNKFNAIQEFFSDISAIRRSALDVPLSLYKQLYSSVQGLATVWNDVTPEAFKRDVNEWITEVQMLTEQLLSNHLVTYGSTPGRSFSAENEKYVVPRAVGGTKNNFIQESVNPNVVTRTGGGLALIGNIEQMISTTAMRPEDVLTGENIFDVAQRLLGDAQRFVDLVIINELKPPFIVADSANKPPSTIAWGEKILVPATEESASLSSAIPVTPAVPAFTDTAISGTSTTFNISTPQIPYQDNMWIGFTVNAIGAGVVQKRVIVSNVDNGDGTTTFTVNRVFTNTPDSTVSVFLELFTSRRPTTPEAAAFGKDILGVFTKINGNVTDGTVDIMLGPTKDLVTTEGLENLEQAITLALQTPRGSNKSNPLYGTSSIIGRPQEPNILALNVFYVRQSLLQDPRISSVEKPEVTYVGGALTFTVFVRPVRVQRTLFFQIPL